MLIGSCPIEEALERTDFEEAWDVLQAMQEQGAALADVIRQMREERGQLGGFDDSKLRERVEVLGPEVSLEILRHAVSTALVDRLGVTWDERYGELTRYKERFADCIPARWGENPQLGIWVGTQRTRRDRLSVDQKTRLDELGLIWDPRDSAWETMFAALKHYRDEHGHCRVPQAWEENPHLGTWVTAQRLLQDTGKLSTDRKNRLDALGFTWDARDALWNERFSELERYRVKYREL